MKEPSLTNQELLDENSRLRRRIQELEGVGEALRASTLTAERYLNVVAEIIISIDRSAKITLLNDSGHKLLGYHPGELIGKNWFEIGLPVENSSEVLAVFSKLMNGELEHVETFENDVKTKSGALRRILWHNTLLKDGEGTITGLLSSGEDITERQQAEDALRVSEKDLKESQRIAHVGSWRLNVATNQVVWSEELYKMYGFDPALPPPPYTEHMKLFTSESWEILSTALAHSRDTGVPYELELKTVRKDGSNGWLWVRGETEADAKGKTVSLWGAAQDITSRKQAETALAAEKERLAVTLRCIGDGVITTDTQGNIVIMNKVAEKLTGWRLSEAQGKPLMTVFHIVNEQTRLPGENPAEKVLATGGIVELANHTLLISRDGTERVIADSGAPIMDLDSVTIGVVLVFRDMTEKQKLLDVIQRTDKLDSLGVLAGGIAHDFNNMLAGIFGYIDLALESTTDKQVTEYLNKSLGVFRRAKDLTQQLLMFSKGGAPQRKTSELAPLIKECVSFVLSGSKVACDYAIDEDLWLADFDNNQIGQVIDNLVINAQEAMPLGGKIVISAKNAVMKEGEQLLLKAGMFIKLSIADTGIGIPADLLKNIFDPFFTTKQKGHGLGLATCYAIVQKHEGSIEVESVMGKGSTFHVFLPASQRVTVQAVSRAAVSHTGRGKILIMDDEPAIREVLGCFLKSMGYTTCEAKDGEEALRLYTEAAMSGSPIDGAFFDLTIPGGMGGKETVAQLRKHAPHLPVYASSGYSEDPVMARPAEYGFTDSIRKPYRKEELAAMLGRHTTKDTSGGTIP
jgi:PAS domain S-box-containing protein